MRLVLINFLVGPAAQVMRTAMSLIEPATIPTPNKEGQECTGEHAVLDPAIAQRGFRYLVGHADRDGDIFPQRD